MINSVFILHCSSDNFFCVHNILFLYMIRREEAFFVSSITCIYSVHLKKNSRQHLFFTSQSRSSDSLSHSNCSLAILGVILNSHNWNI